MSVENQCQRIAPMVSPSVAAVRDTLLERSDGDFDGMNLRSCWYMVECKRLDEVMISTRPENFSGSGEGFDVFSSAVWEYVCLHYVRIASIVDEFYSESYCELYSDRLLSEDVLQEIMLMAWEYTCKYVPREGRTYQAHIKRFLKSRKVNSFMYTEVKELGSNVAMGHHDDHVWPFPFEEAENWAVVKHTELYDSFINAIGEVFPRLTERQQITLEEYYFRGKPVPEICEEQGWNSGVRSGCYRTIKRAREFLKINPYWKRVFAGY